jgi:hypothetical protein
MAMETPPIVDDVPTKTPPIYKGFPSLPRLMNGGYLPMLATGAAQVTAEALENFYKSRMPRVAGISLLSGLASDLIINVRSPRVPEFWDPMMWYALV